MLAAVLASLGSPPPIPGQASHRGDQPAQNPEKQTESVKNPAKPTITLVEKNCDSEQFKNDPDCKKAENDESTVVVSKLPSANVTIQRNADRDTFDWIAYWGGILLVMVGIVGVLIGVWTLKAVRKQADLLKTHATHLEGLVSAAGDNAEAAKDNAKAARLSAEAIVRSERPWLIAVVEKDSKSLHFYSVKIRNVGRTPARFISGDASYMFAERADQLPLPPNYASPIVLPNQLLIAPSHGFPVPHGYDVSHLLQQPEAPNKTLVIYGRVLYRDTIIPDEIRETRWCFGSVFNARTTPGIAEGGFILAGPSEYTDNT